MIKSMTAFSRAENTTGGLSVVIEIRSYNSRNLDLSIHMSHEYISIEDKIRSYINERTARGRIGIRVDIRSERETTPGFQIDRDRAIAYHTALLQLKETLQVEGDISLDLLLSGSDIIKPLDVEKDMDAH